MDADREAQLPTCDVDAFHVDGIAGHDQGEFGVRIEDGPDPEEDDSRRMRDVLDRETIDRIEELHGAVVRSEAEQRFGLLRGKRTRQVAEAEAAEQAFLSANGFATYNDFRLRIRRSTALQGPATEAEVTWDVDDFEPDYGNVASGSGWGLRPDPEDSSTPVDTDIEDTDDDFDEGFDDDQPEEGSAPMGSLPETAPAPASAPSSSQAPRAETAPTAPPDFRRITEPLFASLQAETDRYVGARLEEAERQAADIVARASREANEILSQAARAREAAKAMADEVARRSEAFLSLTEELPARVSSVRDGITAELRSLREVVDSSTGPVRPPSLVGSPAGPALAPSVTPGPVPPSAGPGPVPPSPTVAPGEPARVGPFEPTSSWTPGPRVAPPPPISITSPTVE